MNLIVQSGCSRSVQPWNTCPTRAPGAVETLRNPAEGAASHERRAPGRNARCAGRRPTRPGNCGRVTHASRISSSARNRRCFPRGRHSEGDCGPCRAWRRDVSIPASSARPVSCRQERRSSRASERMRGKRRSKRRRTDTGSTYTPKRQLPMQRKGARFCVINPFQASRGCGFLELPLASQAFLTSARTPITGPG